MGNSLNVIEDFVQKTFTISNVVAKIAIKVATSVPAVLSKRARNSILKATRDENGKCLHILIAPQYQLGDIKFWGLEGEEDVNLNVGTMFDTRGFLHYHPDPSFTPNSKVDFLVRSSWGSGGADAQFDKYSLRNAAEIGYPGFYWRGFSGDRGGGSPSFGVCSVCGLASTWPK